MNSNLSILCIVIIVILFCVSKSAMREMARTTYDASSPAPATSAPMSLPLLDLDDIEERAAKRGGRARQAPARRGRGVAGARGRGRQRQIATQAPAYYEEEPPYDDGSAGQEEDPTAYDDGGGEYADEGQEETGY